MNNRERGTGRYLLEFQWLEPFEPAIDEETGLARSKVQFQIVDHRTEPPKVYWKTWADLEFLYENGGWRLTKTRDIEHGGRGSR